MNKTELVREISKNSGLTIKDAEVALKVLLQSITEALARGEGVSLVGFGQFTMGSVQRVLAEAQLQVRKFILPQVDYQNSSQGRRSRRIFLFYHSFCSK